MELFTMAFVKKYSKDVEYLIDNIDIFFREIDFWEFYIFLCPAHNMKFFKEDVQNAKKNYLKLHFELQGHFRRH